MKNPAPHRTARNLEHGDRIVFDFRGGTNHLGAVTVWDIFPDGANVKLVLVDDARKFHHRKVAACTAFEVAR